MRSLICGFLAVCALGFPRALAAQHNSYPDIARLELRNAAGAWMSSGFQPDGDARVAVLNAHEADTLSVSLSADSLYIILGQCDPDCGDIDLYVTDRSGHTTAQDITTSGHPALSVAPTMTGTYSIRVVMVSCSTEPCYYATQLLAKGRAPAR